MGGEHGPSDPLGPGPNRRKPSVGPTPIARRSRCLTAAAGRLRAPAQALLVTAALVALVALSLGLTRPTAARAAVTTKAAVTTPAAVTTKAAVTTPAAVTTRAAVAAASRKALERSAWHYAMRQHGKPYVWGGTGPYGFDCSGLVYASYRSHGVRLPRTTFDMLRSGRLVWVPKSKARRGDLAFFGSGHVELYDHGKWTYGAANAGSRIGFHRMSSFWHPTMYFRVR